MENVVINIRSFVLFCFLVSFTNLTVFALVDCS